MIYLHFRTLNYEILYRDSLDILRFMELTGKYVERICNMSF